MRYFFWVPKDTFGVCGLCRDTLDVENFLCIANRLEEHKLHLKVHKLLYSFFLIFCVNPRIERNYQLSGWKFLRIEPAPVKDASTWTWNLYLVSGLAKTISSLIKFFYFFERFVVFICPLKCSFCFMRL